MPRSHCRVHSIDTDNSTSDWKNYIVDTRIAGSLTHRSIEENSEKGENDALNEKVEILKNAVSEKIKRSLKFAAEKGASTWLK